jgi:hypothetical protein
MRIEILVGNEEPQIFTLNKPKLVIGSQESCEVVLNADGISRKHITILNEDDNYFVIDQGSTNGSYINEERLVPGRKTEFTSFFPLRLGDNVLVTLLSDTDADSLGYSDDSYLQKQNDFSDPDEGTRAISLKDLQSVKTEKLVKRRQDSAVKRNSLARGRPLPKVKDKTRMVWVQVFGIGIIALAVYFNIYQSTPVESGPPPVEKFVVVEKKIEPKVNFPFVGVNDFTPKEKFDELKAGMVCSTDLEKYLCEKFPAEGGNVIQVGTMVHVFIDGTIYFQKARELVPPYVPALGEDLDPKIVQKYTDDLKLTAAVLFLSDKVPRDLNYELLKGINLTFIISFPNSNATDVTTALAIVPESLSKLKQILDPKQFDLVRRYGGNALYAFKDYFKIY